MNTIVFQYQVHEFPFQIYFVKILLSFKLREKHQACVYNIFDSSDKL